MYSDDEVLRRLRKIQISCSSWQLPFGNPTSATCLWRHCRSELDVLRRRLRTDLSSARSQSVDSYVMMTYFVFRTLRFLSRTWLKDDLSRQLSGSSTSTSRSEGYYLILFAETLNKLLMKSGTSLQRDRTSKSCIILPLSKIDFVWRDS